MSGDASDPGFSDLSALLGSRLCHDLINPIGAISNGLELLGMSGASKAPEMALVHDSVQSAQARIRFYRVAFGSSRADQSMGAPELSGILSDVYGRGRLTAVWEPQGAVSRCEAKLAFLMVLCVEAALARGGQIAVQRKERRWQVSGNGPRYRDLAGIWPVLEGRTVPAAMTPEWVQFPLARLQAQALGFGLVVQVGDDGARITATPE